ncbi:MAG: type II secretion system protein [Victivallaceae bacterium]
MKKNFTLIELMLVIVIIAIFAGLLLPMLNSARSRARRIQDLSNMKQVGVGLQSYSDASNGYMPCYDVGLYNGLPTYYTCANQAWTQLSLNDVRAVGLGLLFAGGYVANPRIFFCTEPYFDGSSHLSYDNPDTGWARWKKPGWVVKLSMGIPSVLYRKGDLPAVKADWARNSPTMSEYPMSNILSDNTKKIVITCYGYKYSINDKPPHDGDGVNIIFGDNSGRWQKIDKSVIVWLAADKSYSASRLFGWLNSHVVR